MKESLRNKLDENIKTLQKIYDEKQNVTPVDVGIDEHHFQPFIKRSMDILISGAGIIALSPLFCIIILLIRLTSHGSAIYKQERIGFNQKRFQMYKFRSMFHDADEKFENVKDLNETNHVMFKSKNDPRITPVGKFLRKWSLDELPQLFNILKGDMSLVGPRPPIERELSDYKPWHYVRFMGKPGLTGMWQINGRSQIKDFDHVVALDYSYLQHWNIFKDLKILIKTIPAVLTCKGAD